MDKTYDLTTSDFEQSTAQKRKNLRKVAQVSEQENTTKVIEKLQIDKHAVTSVEDVVKASDDHPEEIMDAFDAWKEEA